MAEQGQIVSKKDLKLNVEVSLGSFLVHDIELILNSPLLSHIYFQLSKESSDRLNYECGIIVTAHLP